jgi:phosphopantetheine adenylyltransferase
MNDIKVVHLKSNAQQKMKRLNVKLIKWISNKLGFKIVMVRIGNGNIDIEGDKELMRYTDISGYTFKKEPIKRK